MPDLKDQIRSYFDEIDPPFTPVELMREPHRTQHPRRVMTTRAFILAAGAAALVLLLIGGPLLLLRGSPDVDNQPMSPVVTGDVIVHDMRLLESGEGDPWVGSIVEEGPDGEFLFLSGPTGRNGLLGDDGSGLYFDGRVQVTQQWGITDEVESRPYLIRVTDSRVPGAESLEMVWRANAGIDSIQYELSAVLEHVVTEGLRLHPECHTVDTLEFAVALTDTDLTPVAAWKLGGSGIFEDIDPERVQCTSGTTQSMSTRDFLANLQPRRWVSSGDAKPLIAVTFTDEGWTASDIGCDGLLDWTIFRNYPDFATTAALYVGPIHQGCTFVELVADLPTIDSPPVPVEIGVDDWYALRYEESRPDWSYLGVHSGPNSQGLGHLYLIEGDERNYFAFITAPTELFEEFAAMARTVLANLELDVDPNAADRP
jgi:hypothetical protein